MIQTNELRADNWLYYTPENCYAVIKFVGSPIIIDCFTGIRSCEISQLAKIPLTTQILSVLKFQLQDTLYRNTDLKLRATFKSAEWMELRNEENQVVDIDSVHSLQNGCFKLTGLELPVNLIGI